MTWLILFLWILSGIIWGLLIIQMTESDKTTKLRRICKLIVCIIFAPLALIIVIIISLHFILFKELPKIMNGEL